MNNPSSEEHAYLANRELKTPNTGWVLVAGLGVAIVISGDFSGWNFGLALGGWGGMLIATLLTACMYVCITLSLAELSSIMPTAGGFYSYVRRSFGRYPGYCAGLAVAFATIIATGVLASFIEAYFAAVTGIGGWQVKLAFFIFFIGIHIWGVGEALKLMLVIAVIAIIALLLFIGVMLPYFDSANLFNIPISETAVGTSKFLPFGYLGIWACIPFATWFFLGIEYTVMAAEETQNAVVNMPRGMIAAISILVVLALAILVVAPGSGGAAILMDSKDPLWSAMTSPLAFTEPTRLSRLIGVMALFGLIASFFSVIYAYSRQIYSLSRAGYLPTVLSKTGSRKTPVLALIIPGLIGFSLSFVKPDKLLLMTVLLLSLTYIWVLLSHIKLRIKSPDLERPYRTPGGVFTSGLALLLSSLTAIACFLVEPGVVFIPIGLYSVFSAYYFFYSGKNIVSYAPEEQY